MEAFNSIPDDGVLTSPPTVLLLGVDEEPDELRFEFIPGNLRAVFVDITSPGIQFQRQPGLQKKQLSVIISNPSSDDKGGLVDFKPVGRVIDPRPEVFAGDRGDGSFGGSHGSRGGRKAKVIIPRRELVVILKIRRRGLMVVLLLLSSGGGGSGSSRRRKRRSINHWESKHKRIQREK